MRKSNNKGPGQGSKERSFKSKDGSRSGRKQDGAFSDRPNKREGRFGPKKERFGGDDKPRRKPAGEKPFRSRDGERPAKRSGFAASDEKPFRSRTGGSRSFDDKPVKRGEKSVGNSRSRSGDSDERPRRSFDDKPVKRGEKSFGNNRSSSGDSDERPRRSFDKPRDNKTFGRKKEGREKDREEKVKRVKFGDFEEGREFTGAQANDHRWDKKKPGKKPVARQPSEDGMMRLNKYLSNAGVASRREADTLIQSGVVKVNGVVVDQLGYKIKSTDKVTYGDAAVKSERKVYLLLNKPKDYITTTDDPQERKTVMELVAKAGRERIYPVGRLDRNTTGLLLFTNDGELATKLMHPKFRIKKVYHVSLNKGLKPDDFRAIMDGIELEDGPIQADDLAFVGEGKKEIGIEIHSGRNRIVRRIFEHLGYDVIKLDRVSFAGLTKKDLPRGKYRFLTAKEIAFLQMIG